MYKSLKEEIVSRHYRITRLEEPKIESSSDGDSSFPSVRSFQLFNDVYWDTNKGVFLVSGQWGYRVGKEGRLERELTYTSGRHIIERLATNPQKDPGPEDVIYLNDWMLHRGFSEAEALLYILKLHKESEIFEGDEYHLYFKKGATWYFLKNNSGDLKAFGNLFIKLIHQYDRLEKKPEKNILKLQGIYKTQYTFDQIDWRDPGKPVRLDSFEKHYTESSMTSYFMLDFIPTEEVGLGNFSLHYKGEVLRFKSKTQKLIWGWNKYWAYINLYLPPDPENHDFAILSIDDPNDREGDNGLYLIHRLR